MQAAMATHTQQAHKVLVAGLGKTGLSCVRYLLARGDRVTVTDTRVQPPMLDELSHEYPQVETLLGQPVPEQLEEYDEVVVSPGLSIREGSLSRYRAQGHELSGDIELFALAAQAPVIAITGANGKSTVTDLVGHLLQTAGKHVLVGGNIGTPALELLNEPKPEAYVLELSSFQLETTHSLNAVAATVLNISADHMDRYDGIDDYAATKAAIFQGNGVMVLNRDDARVAAMQRVGRETLWFTLGEPQGASDFGVIRQGDEEWIAHGDTPVMPVAEVWLPGRHNLANVLAALALVDRFGLPVGEQRRAVAGYRGLPHRYQKVGEVGDVQWINDSKATNTGACAAALNGTLRPVVWIAGGEGKDADFGELCEAVRGKVRTAVLIGRDAQLIAVAVGHETEVVYARDMDEAVSKAAQAAQPGDAVLLSPACASFDMFDNFEHRGRAFTEAVQRLLKGDKA